MQRKKEIQRIITPGFTAEKTLHPQIGMSSSGVASMGRSLAARGIEARYNRPGMGDPGTQMSWACWWNCGGCLWTVLSCGASCIGKRGYFPCVVNCVSAKQSNCSKCVSCIIG